MAETVRTLGYRSRDAVTRPGGLSDQAHGRFRRWFRRIWEVRGGGLYATGFAVTFLYLEITELVAEDIPQFFALESYSIGELIAFAISFFIDTLINTLFAFLWPAFVVQFSPPVGLIALILAFLLFPRYVKPAIQRWLSRYEDPDPDPDPDSNSDR